MGAAQHIKRTKCNLCGSKMLNDFQRYPQNPLAWMPNMHYSSIAPGLFLSAIHVYYYSLSEHCHSSVSSGKSSSADQTYLWLVMPVQCRQSPPCWATTGQFHNTRSKHQSKQQPFHQPQWYWIMGRTGKNAVEKINFTLQENKSTLSFGSIFRVYCCRTFL